MKRCTYNIAPDSQLSQACGQPWRVRQYRESSPMEYDVFKGGFTPVIGEVMASEDKIDAECLDGHPWEDENASLLADARTSRRENGTSGKDHL